MGYHCGLWTVPGIGWQLRAEGIQDGHPPSGQVDTLTALHERSELLSEWMERTEQVQEE